MVILSNEIIGFINVFERLTRAGVKDCFQEDDTLVFVVRQGQIGKAFGPKGMNIKKLSAMFKKNIKIIGFHSEPTRFVSNLIFPIRAEEIVQDDNVITIRAVNMREKGQIYGRDRTNLRRIQKLVSKYFPGLEVKIE